MKIGQTTATIVLGEKDVVITKLKAGKFYELQKIFADMLSSFGPSVEGDESARTVNIIRNFPEKLAKFVAFCAGMEENEVLENAWPEEITKAFGTCLELNNVFDNLKNSAAPMEMLGGKKE
jgi:hypothetical protein